LTVGKNKKLVSANIRPDAIPDQLLADVEPVYCVSGSSDLRFPPEYHVLLGAHLCHCVARDPSDLRSHVRRILLHLEDSQAIDLYAALVDLFIALGHRGFELRRRMLNMSRSLLKPHQHDVLSEALVTGLDPISVPTVPGSVLSRGIVGSLDMVKPIAEKTSEPRDPLIEAREFLEYSQIEEAREVLERAVMSEPQRSDLHIELLEIYRSTRDKTNFDKMHAKLDGTTNPAHEAWQTLAALFRSLNGQ
jgi:hypothetical protein